jgi:hypothetical protein
LPLWFSLDCPFLIAHSVSSGLTIPDYPFGFLWIDHSSLPHRFFLTFIIYKAKDQVTRIKCIRRIWRCQRGSQNP